MFNNKITLFSFLLMSVGLLLILMGSRWLLHDEPWLLDKVANEDRLNMTFENLFSNEINYTLAGYLKQIYRFFGLWVSIIGLFVLTFSQKEMVQIKQVRVRLLLCMGIMVFSGLLLGYLLIPKSPFIYLGWFLLLVFLFSLYIHKIFLKN